MVNGSDVRNSKRGEWAEQWVRPRGWDLGGRDEDDVSVRRAIATCETISYSRSRSGVCHPGATNRRPPYRLRRRLLKHSPVSSPSPLMTSFTPVSAPSLVAPPVGPNGAPPSFPKKRKRGATRLSCAECRR